MIEDLIEKLEEQLTPELHFGQMPDTPNDLVVINLGGGNSPIHSLGKATPMIRQIAIQVVTRNLSYLNGASQLDLVATELFNMFGELNDDYDIMGVTQSSDILDLGRDEKNRYLFSLNFTIKLHRR